MYHLTETDRHIYDSFKDLRFDEKYHSYSIIRGGQKIILPSVSSIVAGLAPKFNKDILLPASAKKHKIPVGDLEFQWAEKNRIACELGHKTHDFLERYTGLEIPHTPQERAGVKYIRSLEGRYRISFRELRAYSREYLFAGTMDLPLQRIEGTDYIIADYKTNSTDLFKAYSLLHPPFETMEASAYNKYQIQLSLYQIMLEEIGLTISGRALVHLNGEGEFVTYELHDLTEYLKEYMSKRIAA